MSVPAATTLGYALLGFLRDGPRSGYALRKVFETTPMGNYSSSPGSIYPALKSLEKAGLISAEPAARGSLFTLLPEGQVLFAAWLAQPLTASDVRTMDIVMLRFAFLQNYPDRAVTRSFLISLADTAYQQQAGIRSFMRSDDWAVMDLQARLAVDFGLRSLTTIAAWAVDALQQLEKQWQKTGEIA